MSCAPPVRGRDRYLESLLAASPQVELQTSQEAGDGLFARSGYSEGSVILQDLTPLAWCSDQRTEHHCIACGAFLGTIDEQFASLLQEPAPPSDILPELGQRVIPRSATSNGCCGSPDCVVPPSLTLPWEGPEPDVVSLAGQLALKCAQEGVHVLQALAGQVLGGFWAAWGHASGEHLGAF